MVLSFLLRDGSCIVDSVVTISRFSCVFSWWLGGDVMLAMKVAAEPISNT